MVTEQNGRSIPSRLAKQNRHTRSRRGVPSSAVVADVDGDGDLDICSKLWRARKDNANGGRNHPDFLENLATTKAK